MSLLDDVSIVVTPNGYKAGELYAVIPSDGAADMDVTRATAATRVDENGLVNYAEVIGGEEVTCGDFECAVPLDSWSVSNGTITDKYNASMTSYQSGIRVNPFNRTGTFKVTFDLVVTSGSCKFYAGGTNVQLYSTSGTKEIIIINPTRFEFNAFNIGWVGTLDNVSVKEVTRDNVPRIDYTGGGCPHILAEPMRTNIVFPSDVAVTQTRTVTAVAYALSFYGTGSIVLSGTHSATLVGTGVNDRVDLIFTPTAGSLVLTVSGTVTNFQLEVGSYATSLIPTVSGQVTRNQDIFTRDGIGSLINSTEGVLFAEWKPKLSSDYSILSINNGTSGSSVLMGKGASSSTIFIGVRSGYGYQMLYTLSPYDFTNFIKVAVKWKVNDFAVWIDGVEVATDTSGNAPVGLNKLSFDFGDGGFDFYGEVKQLQVYTTAISDTQLAALTS